MTKKSNDFVLSSREELHKQAAKELDKFVKEEKKAARKVKKESSIERLVNAEEKRIQEEIARILCMTNSERVDWICEKHYSFIQSINWKTGSDFLKGTTYYDRHLITIYVQELLYLLTTYNLEFNREMTNILIERNEVELLSLLNILNYL